MGSTLSLLALPSSHPSGEGSSMRAFHAFHAFPAGTLLFLTSLLVQEASARLWNRTIEDTDLGSVSYTGSWSTYAHGRCTQGTCHCEPETAQTSQSSYTQAFLGSPEDKPSSFRLNFTDK
jgi:hypothetical protein